MRYNEAMMRKLILILVILSWLGLFYLDGQVQAKMQENNETFLTEMAAVLTRSVSQALSLKLDYNREAMQGIYLQEILAVYIQPVEILQGGYAWIVADDMLYLGSDPFTGMPVGEVQTETLRAAVKNDLEGSAQGRWAADSSEAAHSWRTVGIEGYEWQVGVSLPLEAAKNQRILANPFVIAYGLVSILILLAVFLTPAWKGRQG